INTIVQKAKLGSLNKATFPEVMTKLVNKFGIKPFTSSSIHCHERAITITGKAQGIIKKVRYMPCSLGIRLRARAAVNPIITWKKIKKNVHLKDTQNDYKNSMTNKMNI